MTRFGECPTLCALWSPQQFQSSPRFGTKLPGQRPRQHLPGSSPILRQDKPALQRHRLTTRCRCRLPSNLEAERAILGGVLLDNACLAALATAHPEDFFLRQNQMIARAMISLGLLNTPIDLVTLLEQLERHGVLDDAGGAAYIATLADGLPRTVNIDHYARIVREKSHLRAVAFGAEAIQLAALEPDADLAELTLRIQNLAEAAARSPQPRLKSVTSEGLLRLEVAAREMILAPVLPTQGLGMLYSKRGLGKTYMSLSIAHAVASGGAFLGWTAPRARPVLFVDGELPLSTLKDRLAAVTQGAEKQAEPGMLRLITPDLQTGAFPDLATAEGQSLIENALDGAEFVILDNLSALCRTGKENEGESWLPVQRWALRLRQLGISVLFVHHAGKGGAQRGTSRREDLLDVVINLRHPADYNPAEGLRCEVHYEKCRGFYGEDAKPFEVKMEQGRGGEAVWTKRDLENVMEARAAALFEDGAKVREVAAQIGISRSVAGRIRRKCAVEDDREPGEEG